MKKILLILSTVLSIALLSFTPIDKQFATSLTITVRNELGNTEEGVKVQLFKNEEDYNKGTNPVTEAKYTDAKGKVFFKNISPTEYYVLAEKGDANNFGGGEKTGKVEEGKNNKVTLVIE